MGRKKGQIETKYQDKEKKSNLKKAARRLWVKNWYNDSNTCIEVSAST